MSRPSRHARSLAAGASWCATPWCAALLCLRALGAQAPSEAPAPPDLSSLAFLVGRWTCEDRYGDGGVAPSTAAFAWAHRRFWIQGRVTEPPTAQNPWRFTADEAFGRATSGGFVLQGTGVFAAVPPLVARAWAGDTLRFHRMGRPLGDTAYDVVLVRRGAGRYQQAEYAPRPADRLVKDCTQAPDGARPPAPAPRSRPGRRPTGRPHRPAHGSRGSAPSGTHRATR